MSIKTADPQWRIIKEVSPGEQRKDERTLHILLGYFNL